LASVIVFTQTKIKVKTKAKTGKGRSSEANMLVQRHPTLFDATCWHRLNTMLDNVGRCLTCLKF